MKIFISASSKNFLETNFLISKLEEREDNSIRRRAYNKWAEEICNENILDINISSSI